MSDSTGEAVEQNVISIKCKIVGLMAGGGAKNITLYERYIKSDIVRSDLRIIWDPTPEDELRVSVLVEGWIIGNLPRTYCVKCQQKVKSIEENGRSGLKCNCGSFFDKEEVEERLLSKRIVGLLNQGVRILATFDKILRAPNGSVVAIDLNLTWAEPKPEEKSSEQQNGQEAGEQVLNNQEDQATGVA